MRLSDYFGQTVNKAARIAAAASDAVHGLVEQGTEFQFGEPMQLELKGIDGPASSTRSSSRPDG